MIDYNCHGEESQKKKNQKRKGFKSLKFPKSPKTQGDSQKTIQPHISWLKGFRGRIESGRSMLVRSFDFDQIHESWVFSCSWPTPVSILMIVACRIIYWLNLLMPLQYRAPDVESVANESEIRPSHSPQRTRPSAAGSRTNPFDVSRWPCAFFPLSTSQFF